MATGVERARRAEVRKPLQRPYIPVFVALGILTLIEVQILGQIFLLMLFAISKAALVVLYYMHVRYEPRALALVALIPLVLAIGLLVALLGETF